MNAPDPIITVRLYSLRSLQGDEVAERLKDALFAVFTHPTDDNMRALQSIWAHANRILATTPRRVGFYSQLTPRLPALPPPRDNLSHVTPRGNAADWAALIGEPPTEPQPA